VEYIRRRVFCEPGCEEFDTLADANRFLFEGCMRLNRRTNSNEIAPMDLFEQEKAFLLPQLPKFESCLISECRVDKYSTIVVSQNHYSVPDHLVKKLLKVRTYTDKIVVYHDNMIVVAHDRSYLNHDWKIELRHYLRTLHKKPGALHQSTAMLQADTKIKNIYEHYYSKDAKIFLEIMEIINEKGVDAVDDSLRELERISPLDMSADKVRAICDYSAEKKNCIRKEYTDPLSQKSRTNLSMYNQLAVIQSEKLTKEAV